MSNLRPIELATYNIDGIPMEIHMFREHYEIKVGSLRSMDLPLRVDKSVSRIHASIACEDGKWYVLDLGSACGTKVNGKRVYKERLRYGDEIYFGNAKVTVRIFDKPTVPWYEVNYVAYICRDCGTSLHLDHDEKPPRRCPGCDLKEVTEQ